MALELRIPVLQIVGYQNSGKTTLVSKLVQKLSSDGISVGTIKHHGHGGVPKVGDSGKDTDSHRLAGAAVVSVEGSGSLQLSADVVAWDVERTISLYKNFNLDMIIIEGYKMEKYPKVVLIRNANDIKLLHRLTNIITVIYEDSIPNEELNEFTCFLRSEEEAYMTYLLERIKGVVVSND